MADRPNPKQPRTASKRRIRRLMATAIIACSTIGTGSGCSMMGGLGDQIVHSECIDEFMVDYRNSAWSARSWHANKHRFCNQQHNRDFMAGYRAGYEDVANGGNGCTPSLPPREYWGWRYQSPEGQSKVGAWFSGYPHGAAAAEKDGLGTWGQIRTMLPETTTMPPASPSDEVIPAGGTPTPIDGISGDSAPTLSPAQTAGRLGTIDLSSLTTVTADSVPTVATGR